MKRYGLIGYPLTHSFSEAYFSEKFKKEGIDASYTAYPLQNLGLFNDLVRDQGPFHGLNVTLPFKEKIIEYLDELDKTASDVGAVNLILFSYSGSKMKLIGYNTDVFGFSESLDYFGIRGVKNALVLGTGGASRAVIYSLRTKGSAITRVSRESDRGDLTYIGLNKSSIDQFDLIVNTTPVGTFPSTDESPDIPYRTLNPSTTLYDLVYNPEETLFLKKGREMGCYTINGIKMLHLQAEKGWKIWNSANP